MMAALDQESLHGELKKKRICRFCLTLDCNKISNIFMRDTRIKSSAPLPIQIMAIASIEVFSNDGMPPFICTDCTNMFEYSYQFKQMCKKADNLLRQFPLTGKWPACLDKPVMPMESTPIKITKTTQARMYHNPQFPTQRESLLLPKKILNTSVYSKSGGGAETITPDITPISDQGTRIVAKIEKPDTDCAITFLDKIENNEELSYDDIHQLVAAEEINDTEEENMENLFVVKTEKQSNKPKLLNKSSMRILNKDAETGKEPRLSLPKIKQNINGTTEIIAEILNQDDIYEGEADPSNALPIETNIFPCSQCERSFPLLQLRDLHMKNHARDRKFHCDHCEKSFFSKYDLHRHSFIHNGEKPYKCSVCDKAFSRSGLLTRHEKSHTDVPKFICIHCERPFISKDDMEKHAEKHNINRPFVCKICNKGFAFKQGLERHEGVHSRQQPFSCRYCSESFSTTSKLARHLTAHAGQRPYPCKFCRKSYLLSHHLTRHMRSHKNNVDCTNIISFTCMRCDESFDSREDLIKHSSTHASEINLSCPMCKDVFDNMMDLVSHIEEHSSGEIFACEFCDLIFMSADKLQSHTDSDHAQEMEAYYEDDRAEADKQNEVLKGEQNNDDILQNSVNEFLGDEQEHTPKIINQIIIQSPGDDQQHQNVAEEGKSLLIPLKQRRLSITGKKVTTQREITQETKSSPQIKRKTPNATQISPRNLNQPSIQSMFKIPQNVAVTKTPTAKTTQARSPTNKTPPTRTPSTRTPPTKASPTGTIPIGTSSSKAVSPKLSPPLKVIKTEPMPTIKVEKDEVDESTSSASIDSGFQPITEKKKGKVQKITVTKAQAAAMAKEGRIKIKDGKIILKK